MALHMFETLADSFVAEGIETCFALLGDANMNWATALSERGVRMIYVRHEHCAVAAATAYARKTGKVGIATVTCGPGVTQILTALPAAVRARIPLVIFAGESPLGAAWYNQELDQAPLITATGAIYRQLHHIPRMTTEIRDAFATAQEQRCPVVIGVPLDLQSKPAPDAAAPPASSDAILPRTTALRPNPADVTDLTDHIAQVRRIVVMAGLGAAGAVDACRALADKTGALLATTLPARGLFHGDPFSVGIAGGYSSTLARALFAEADLVIAVGCRLSQHTLDKGKLFPGAEILQIDTDPRALSQGMAAANRHLCGDAKLAVEALTQAMPQQPGWRNDRLAAAITDAPSDTAEFPPEPNVLDPRDVVAALDAALPQDWQMVNSSGHCAFFSAHMNRPFATFLTIREFGAIGNGISYAMGVAAARPDDTVVLFDGDGSLLMHVQELETIRRHGLNILICALNDRAYGSEIHKLRDEGLSDAGAVFGATDLASIARGFGIAGHRVDDLTQLPALVAEFARSGGAAVWDFPISDHVASPVIRRAHPTGHSGTERPIDIKALL
ncbi:thiamine pyrophosphate-binding protein [Puniceibacterium sp. IMCC21224]|uniref:thiamine pyrophosphate-binding protein n=1 Tax=Puniceibacterium sp. IMCC21224 TaxID=1618204 RepID=UPI00064DBD66|nr:thiamine pyrophosphate-binding protein [Puniceibacterium sp. IMCC21224]KMK68823.1 thiamine pyrophosphate-dependent enzyme, possible carboligase or decarboxylase [Puniceibacterium sp. IMCC21224]